MKKTYLKIVLPSFIIAFIMSLCAPRFVYAAAAVVDNFNDSYTANNSLGYQTFLTPSDSAETSVYTLDNFNDTIINPNYRMQWEGYGNMSVGDTLTPLPLCDGTRMRALTWSNDLLNGDDNGWFATNLSNNSTVDMSGRDIIAFEIRGTANTGDVCMRLQDPANTADVRLSGITTDWRTVRIPLTDFSGVNIAALRAAAMIFNGAGTIYIDNLRFSTANIQETKLHNNNRWFPRPNRARKITFPSGAAMPCLFTSNLTSGSGYFNASSYSHLSFRVKGRDGGETFNVELQYGSVPLTLSVSVGSYAAVTGEWQNVDIPLDDFVIQGLVKTQLVAVRMSFDSSFVSGGKVVYIDNLQFSNGHFAKPQSTGDVRVDFDRKVLQVKNENDEYVDFIVKGVGYQAIPIGGGTAYFLESNLGLSLDLGDPLDTRTRGRLLEQLCDRNFPIVKLMGANTIRTWGDPTTVFMDRAAAHGLKVLVGFYINADADFTPGSTDRDGVNGIVATFTRMVEKYRDHDWHGYDNPILGWLIGNEVNLHFDASTPAARIQNFYGLVNELARIAYATETENNPGEYHPAIPINGNLFYIGDDEFGSDDLQLDYVDMWGSNLYAREYADHAWLGDAGKNLFGVYAEKSCKPLIVTEYGIDAFSTVVGAMPPENPDTGFEKEVTQADWMGSNFLEISQYDNIAAAGTVFEYTDEWWKFDRLEWTDAVRRSNQFIHHTNGARWFPPLAGQPSDQPDGYSNEEFYGAMQIAPDGTWSEKDGLDDIKERRLFTKLLEVYRGNEAIWLDNFSIQDHEAGVNNDGYFNPNETVFIKIKLRNRSAANTNVIARLKYFNPDPNYTDPYISIKAHDTSNPGEINFGVVDSGAAAEGMFKVSSDFAAYSGSPINHQVDFMVELTYPDPLEPGRICRTDFRLPVSVVPAIYSSIDERNMNVAPVNSVRAAYDTHGCAYLTWEKTNTASGFKEVYFASSSDFGKTWALPQKINKLSNFNALNPQIACDDFGRVYVIWEDARDGGKSIYMNRSKDHGKTWLASDVKLNHSSAARTAQNARLHGDANGYIYVTWQEDKDIAGNPDIYFNYSTNFGYTWQQSDIRISADAGVNSSVKPLIAADDKGHAYIVWTETTGAETSTRVSSSGDFGAAWSSVDQVDLLFGASTNPQDISCDGEGRVFVIFGDNNKDVYFSSGEIQSDASISWQDYSGDRYCAINTASSMMTRALEDAQISNDNDGRVYITWSGRPQGAAFSNIYFVKSANNGVSWEAIQQLSSAPAPGTYNVRPMIVSDAHGGVYAAWLSNRGGGTAAIGGDGQTLTGTGWDIYYDFSMDFGVNWNSSCEGPSNGMVLYYDFEDDFTDNGYVEDKSGNGNNITLVRPSPCPISIAPLRSNGIKGHGIEFFGNYATFLRKDTAPVNPTAGLNAMTVSVWFKTPQCNKNIKLLSAAWWRGGPRASGWNFGTHYPELWADGGAGTLRGEPAWYDVTRFFIDGAWNHAVLTWEKTGKIREYINARLVYEWNVSEPPKDLGSGARLIVGGWDTSTNPNTTSVGFPIKGTMDEIRIYNRALTIEEVFSLYQGFADDFRLTQNPSPSLSNAFLSSMAADRAGKVSLAWLDDRAVASSSDAYFRLLTIGPRLDPIPDYPVIGGETLTFQVTAADPRKMPLVLSIDMSSLTPEQKFMISNAAFTQEFDPDTGVTTGSFEWTPPPDVDTAFSLRFIASDAAHNRIVSQTMTVQVAEHAMLIDDYNDADSALNFQRYPSIANARVVAFGETNNPAFDGSKVLRVKYSDTDGEEDWYRSMLWDGVDQKTQKDITEYNGLHFLVRGEQGGETFKIGLLYDGTSNKEPSISYIESSAHFYVPAGAWKVVQLRLSDFSPANLRKISGVCFVFHGKGVVSLENLKFVDESDHGEFDPTFIELSGRRNGGTAFIEAVSSSPRETNGLVAKIQVPYEDSRVRGNVPVFGLAYGKDFKEYRVEYGCGKNPDKWIAICSSAVPQDKKVPSAERKFGEGKTVHGNLATWDTGLQNYYYGDEFPPDHPVDLNGIYTLRLVVTNSDGMTAEDRITLSVGRVISNIFGGIAKDPAGEVILDVPEHALDSAFRVICINETPAAEDLKYKENQRLISVVYEINPQKETFTRDSVLSIKLPENAFELNGDSLGIYAYNEEKKEWEYFPGTVDKEKGFISAGLRGIPEGRGLFAILEDKRETSDKVIAGLSSVNYHDRVDSAYSGIKRVKDEETLVSYDFEDGTTAGWSGRNGYAGAKLYVEDSGRWLNKKALKLIDVNGGGNFASTIISQPFDAKEYPKIAFDYQIREGVKVNIMAKMDGKWYDVEFTDDPKKYQNINMEKIGKIAGVRKDGRWHRAEFNLYEMLKSQPSLRNQDKFVIDEIIMADWNEDGFMKLVYGNNPKGAYYAVDNFTIKKDTPALFVRLVKKMSDYMFGAWPDNKDAAAAYAKPVIAEDLFVVDEYNLPPDKTALSEAEGIFHGPGQYSDIAASIDLCKERGYCLKLDYNVPSAGDYAGYYRLLKGCNISSYNTLNFWIKGNRAGERISVGLKNSRGEESKVNAAAFVENGINRNWQKASIPLAAFVNVKDFSSMENLSFIFEESAGSNNGIVYIDDISFGLPPAPLIVADFSDCAGKTIWGKEYWTFNTRAASIYTGLDSFGCLIQYHGVESKRENISWAGWGIDLDGLNVTGYETLALRLKRIHGTERPNLYLADSRIERYVDLEDYMTGASWEDVRVPLKVFAEKGINLSDLKKLTISFEWEKMDGAIYVDDIAFVPFSELYLRAKSYMSKLDHEYRR